MHCAVTYRQWLNVVLSLPYTAVNTKLSESVAASAPVHRYNHSFMQLIAKST